MIYGLMVFAGILGIPGSHGVSFVDPFAVSYEYCVSVAERMTFTPTEPGRVWVVAKCRKEGEA